jgi:hypothetical protein
MKLPTSFVLFSDARYDPDIDGPVAPRAAAKAMGKQAEAEVEAGDPGSVATKDVNAMYLVMRQRVAKMEARVDERLNQVNGLNSTFELRTLSSHSLASGRINALRNFAAAG